MPRLSATALWKRLEQGQVDRCYLFFGEEAYLIQEYTTIVIDRLLGTAPRDFNCDVLHADNDVLEDALSLARTLPMMAPCRVVVLHGVQQLRKADWPPFERYLAAPSPSTALVCSGVTSDQKKYPPGLFQHAVTVECARLEGSRLQEWVGHIASSQGYRMSTAAIQTLLHEQQSDLQTLKQEIDKLCTYAGETLEISAEDVQTVTQASRVQSIFALSDALGARQIGPALRLLERLLYQGEPPLVILSMMVRHVRLLWSVKQLAQQRQDAAQIAKALNLPVGVCRQLLPQSQQFAREQLRQLYSAALEADLTFKSSNKPPQAILEELILHVCMQSRGVRSS